MPLALAGASSSAGSGHVEVPPPPVPLATPTKRTRLRQKDLARIGVTTLSLSAAIHPHVAHSCTTDLTPTKPVQLALNRFTGQVLSQSGVLNRRIAGQKLGMHISPRCDRTFVRNNILYKSLLKVLLCSWLLMWK